jgi:cytochrome c biogenesis protein CcmG/thiol:disulfide interchange protein DsbE
VRQVLRFGSRAALWLAVAAVVAVAAFVVTRAPRGPLANGVPVAHPQAGDDWERKAAPDFELSTLDGHRIRLSDLRGRVVLVNFWATWCAPCRVEMPWLSDFAVRYRDQGLTVLGISVDDGGRDRVERFVRERPVRYPILLNHGNVDQRYGGVRFLPQTFFVGRDGRIISRVYGIRTHADFERDIRSALGLPSPTG